MRRSAAIPIFIVLIGMSFVSACGEDTNISSTTPAGECACLDNDCDVGQCILEVVVTGSCAEAWGTASVFVNDLDSDATPEGEVTSEVPFRSCAPFSATAFDAEGNQISSGESFTFIVESEDGRLLSGSTGGEMFQCASSSPFIWTIDGC